MLCVETSYSTDLIGLNNPLRHLGRLSHQYWFSGGRLVVVLWFRKRFPHMTSATAFPPGTFPMSLINSSANRWVIVSWKMHHNLSIHLTDKLLRQASC